MALLRRFLPLLRPYRVQAALALLFVLWRPALNTNLAMAYRLLPTFADPVSAFSAQ